MRIARAQRPDAPVRLMLGFPRHTRIGLSLQQRRPEMVSVGPVGSVRIELGDGTVPKPYVVIGDRRPVLRVSESTALFGPEGKALFRG